MTEHGRSGASAYDPWASRWEAAQAHFPELSREQFASLVHVLAIYFQIKAKHETRWTEEQRQCLRQLDPDVWHSALLWRMLGEHKPPLVEPPPVEHAYPVYPPADADAQGIEGAARRLVEAVERGSVASDLDTAWTKVHEAADACRRVLDA